MKKIMVIIFAFCVALLYFTGCGTQNAELELTFQSAEFNMEELQDNYEIPYIKMKYNGFYSDDNDDQSWTDSDNLTSTATFQKGHIDVWGAEMICNMDEYNNILQTISDKKQFCKEKLGAFKEPETVVNTLDIPVNQAFFDNCSLVLIDCCYKGCPTLYSRLDSVLIEGKTARIMIQQKPVLGSCADREGEVFWIAVPQKCKDVSVQIEYELNVSS